MTMNTHTQDARTRTHTHTHTHTHVISCLSLSLARVLSLAHLYNFYRELREDILYCSPPDAAGIRSSAAAAAFGLCCTEVKRIV